MSELPIIPAPRAFFPSGRSFSPQGVAVSERLVDPASGELGFQPRHVPDEAYAMLLQASGIEIRALSPRGLHHARSTLAQLLAAEAVPCGIIQDEPRFAWRGFMLDCSRHFYPVAAILAHLDRLAALKYNRFHWHLVDDQGWRIEVPALPRLTEIGAWRLQADGSRYGGFYTTADILRIVAYASERGITVVPEIELPGHSAAALAAYPELSCSGEAGAVINDWGIFDKIYCASSEQSFRILETVLDEVCRLFPGNWVHIGGDEVIRTAWERCPRCQEMIRTQELGNEAGLEARFFRHFIGYLASRGKTAIGWSELFEHDIPQNIPIQWWLHPELAIKALKAGNPLLVSNTQYSYFDYPYTINDPWFKDFMVPLPVEKVYANPVVPEGGEAWIDQILGGEACLWTEQVPPATIVERLHGRLEAFAEVYWCFDRRPGWESFSRRLAIQHRQTG